MRNNNTIVLSAGDSLTTAGQTIDSGQIFAASFLASFSDSNAAGTFTLEASNDPYTASGGQFVPTEWAPIPTQSATITSGGSALLTIGQMAYRWIRAKFTSTGTGAQTAAPIADTGRKQVQTITAITDVAGSLNSKYYLLSSVNLVTKAQKNFYLWLDNGSGVDPAVAGRTGIQVSYSNDDTGSTIATAMRAALNGLTNDFVATGASAAVITTDVAFGPVTAAVDGAAPTGFTFGAITAGLASNLNNKYFLLNAANGTPLYYVWMNVDTIGTDPLIAGRTALPIAFASGSSAATVGTALAAAIDALAAFVATGTTTVTITNAASGPFVPITDGVAPTGFTFAITAGGTGTITVAMNALGF